MKRLALVGVALLLVAAVYGMGEPVRPEPARTQTERAFGLRVT